MTEMTEVDVRVYPRKIFQCRAKLSMIDTPSVDAWTVDISLGGMSLMLACPIDPGQYCVIKFETTIDEKPKVFSAIARSVYSVCSSTGQYRIGFQFHNLSSESASIIEALKD